MNTPTAETLTRAADLLAQYAGYIREVKPDDLERHPYLPELEELANEVRSLAAPLQPMLRVHSNEAAPGFVLVPLRMTRAMEDVIVEEGWQWGDLLAAAEAITEEQYAEANKENGNAVPPEVGHPKTYQHDVEVVRAEMMQAALDAWRSANGLGFKSLHHVSRDEQNRWFAVVNAVTKIDRKTQAEGFWNDAKPAMQHTGECATDDISRQVCEDIYRERCDDNLALCEALRAVYALYGEDKQVKKIVHDAIKAHGIDHE